MWVWSEAWVVLVGSRSMAKEALLHQVLRNVLQPIYLGLQDVTLQDLSPQSLTLKQNTRQNYQRLRDTGRKGKQIPSYLLFYSRTRNAIHKYRYLRTWKIDENMQK